MHKLPDPIPNGGGEQFSISCREMNRIKLSIFHDKVLWRINQMIESVLSNMNHLCKMKNLCKHKE